MLISTTSTLDGKPITKLSRSRVRRGDPRRQHLPRHLRRHPRHRRRPLAAYEQELRKAKDIAVREMIEQAQALGANAIVGVDLDYENVGQSGGMLMVSASGTAVVIE